MRSVCMLALFAALSGCGWLGASEPDAPPVPAEAPVADAAAGVGAAQLASYIDTVCRLYTEPSCIQAQQGTCAAVVTFPDVPRCTAFLQQAASTCDGLVEQLAAHEPQVAACQTAVREHTCGGDEPMCDAAGARFDTRGACARVAALIAECDEVSDTGS